MTLKRTIACLPAVFFSFCYVYAQTHIPWSQESNSQHSPSGLTEHPGGIITDNSVVFYNSKSPYWLRNDLIIDKTAEVIIEPGVEIKFEPQVGITVRGILTAVVRFFLLVIYIIQREPVLSMSNNLQ